MIKMGDFVLGIFVMRDSVPNLGKSYLYIIGILPAYIYRLVGKGNPHISCILWGQRLELGQLN